MLKQIIRKEILDHLMSLRFSIACILCFGVIVVGFFVRSIQFTQDMADYHESKAMDQKTVEEGTNPYSLYDAKAHKKPNPLRVFVRGTNTDATGSLRLNGYGEMQTRDLQNPTTVLFPFVDFISFVGIIMSLIAIIFGYDAICGEKEKGTLRLVLSQSVPRDTVLLGKWLGGFISLVSPLIVSLIAVSAILLMQSKLAMSSSQWFKLGTVIGLGIVYTASIYSLAILVSTVVKQSSTSIMILTSAWLIFALAWPNMAPHFARFVTPTSELEEIRVEESKAIGEEWKEYSDASKAWWKEQGVTGNWWEEMNWGDWENGRKRYYEFQVFMAEVEKKTRKATDRVSNNFRQERRNIMDRQISVSRWVSRLSPYSCFALAAAELADEGVVASRHFPDAVTRFSQKVFRDFASDEQVAYVKKSLELKGKSPNWKEMRRSPPRFAYQPPVATDSFGIVVVDAMILVGLTIMFCVLAFFCFMRYDVR